MNILWTDSYEYLESFVEDLHTQEEYADLSEVALWEEATFINNEYLNDAKLTFDHEADTLIVAAYDFGLWDGHYFGFSLGANRKEYGTNLNGIFIQANNPDYYECSFVIEDGDVSFIGGHHDGTNRVTFRRLKERVKPEDLEDCDYEAFLAKTTSLVPEVYAAWGVEMPKETS